jgi:plastocyanin
MRPSHMMATTVALGFTVALAIPVAAQAATKSVDMGVPRPAQRALQSTASDVNDFFPHKVTIHVNDTVRFVPAGFHTVDLGGRRTQKLPIITPLNVAPIAGVVDAAGAPFWFNGQRQLGFNPTLLRPGFGKRFSYNGSKAVLSGLPLARNPKPMSVRFTKTGTFRYFCDIHPGMTGLVKVVKSSSSVPSTRADVNTVRRQVDSTLNTAKSLSRSTPTLPPNTVEIGLQGKGGVSFFGFKPAALTVPTGTTVNFRMGAKSEIHTATTGPGDPEKQPSSYLGQVEAGLQGAVLDPRGVYPSQPPGTLGVLTPALHGNGFWNSGALDKDSATTTVAPNSAVTFGAPGTYAVFCMIHPFMKATVTVQ